MDDSLYPETRAFQRAIDETCTLLLSPQRVALNTVLLFLPVNFNFWRKKPATKFLCVKTSSGKVVATSFLYPMVHRWIAGDVPIYLKFARNVCAQKPPCSRADSRPFKTVNGVSQSASHKWPINTSLILVNHGVRVVEGCNMMLFCNSSFLPYAISPGSSSFSRTMPSTHAAGYN